MTRLSKFLLAIFLLTSAFAADKERSSLSPAWRTDVRTALWGSPVPVYAGIKNESHGRAASSLWFADRNTVLATFVTVEQGNNPRLSHRGSPDNTLPLRLNVVYLDANTGKITDVKAVPVSSRGARIVAVHEGKLLILAGADLALYSSNLTLQKRITLAPIGLVGWIPHVSPSGKNALFSSEEMQNSRWIWVDTDTLTILSSWEDNPTGFVTISDQSLATSTCWTGRECKSMIVTPNEASACVELGLKCDSEIKIRTLSQDWETVAHGEQWLRPKFLNDDAILLFLRDGRIKLITSGGKLLFEQTQSAQGGCWDQVAVTSSEGKRFVMPGCQLTGRNTTFDVSGHSVLKRLTVYDLQPVIRTEVFDVRGAKISDEMTFALSPDGSRLAILSDQFVQVFQLPKTS